MLKCYIRLNFFFSNVQQSTCPSPVDLVVLDHLLTYPLPLPPPVHPISTFLQSPSQLAWIIDLTENPPFALSNYPSNWPSNHMLCLLGTSRCIEFGDIYYNNVEERVWNVSSQVDWCQTLNQQKSRGIVDAFMVHMQSLEVWTHSHRCCFYIHRSKGPGGAEQSDRKPSGAGGGQEEPVLHQHHHSWNPDWPTSPSFHFHIRPTRMSASRDTSSRRGIDTQLTCSSSMGLLHWFSI